MARLVQMLMPPQIVFHDSITEKILLFVYKTIKKKCLTLLFCPYSAQLVVKIGCENCGLVQMDRGGRGSSIDASLNVAKGLIINTNK